MLVLPSLADCSTDFASSRASQQSAIFSAVTSRPRSTARKLGNGVVSTDFHLPEGSSSSPPPLTSSPQNHRRLTTSSCRGRSAVDAVVSQSKASYVRKVG